MAIRAPDGANKHMRISEHYWALTNYVEVDVKLTTDPLLVVK